MGVGMTAVTIRAFADSDVEAAVDLEADDRSQAVERGSVSQTSWQRRTGSIWWLSGRCPGRIRRRDGRWR